MTSDFRKFGLGFWNLGLFSKIQNPDYARVFLANTFLVNFRKYSVETFVAFFLVAFHIRPKLSQHRVTKVTKCQGISVS